MSDENQTSNDAAETAVVESANAEEGGTANIIYILYLVAILVGITSIVGVIMAYINRGDAPAWVQTHYTYQIRTFWILLVGGIISIILMIVFIGFLTGLALTIWLIVRCVKGMKWNSLGQPVPNPTSWLFGDAK